MKKIRAAVVSLEEPEDKELLWIDVSNPQDVLVKIYDEGRWKIISTSGIFGNYITPTDLANVLNNYVTNTSLGNTLNNMHITLTEAAYTALQEKNPNTYYYTYEEEE